MDDLEAEIARIAALRGKRPEDYAPENRPKLGPAKVHLTLILTPLTATTADLLATDALPRRSREFLRESPVMLSSLAWADALTAGVDEGLLIQAVRVAVEARLGQSLDTFRRHRRRRLP